MMKLHKMIKKLRGGGRLTALLVVVLAAGLLAPTAFATNYTWSGGGGDGRWTNPSNWGGGGYPQSSGDAALFNSDATVTLDSGNTLTVGYVSVGANKTVTLNGTEGSALNPYKTADINGNGFVVAAGGKLILNVPVVSTGRIDKWGQGELVANANITVTGTDSAGYYFFVDCGTMTLQGSAVLSVPVGYLTLGNSTSSLPMSLVIKDSARVSAYGIRATIATNPGTDAGHIVQDGVDTEVSAYRVVLSGVAGRPEAMGIYELKAGTFTVGEGNIVLGMTGVGSNLAPFAGGRFVQSGGHAVVSNKFSVVYDTDGSGIYLSGGTLTFVTSYYTASSAMIGAPLNLSGSPTIDVQGPCLTFPVATTFAPDTVLTKTGLYNSNLIVNNDLAMDGSLVVKNGYFLAGYSYDVKDVELSAPDDDHSAWPVTLDGGIFNVSLVRSRVTRPLALTIENGGKVRFPFTTDQSDPNPIYARSILVAHSLVVDGETKAKGRYTKSNLPGIFSSDAADNASVVVPYVWTGAGDGTSWDDAANWDGGDVPPSGATTAVDLSRAGGKTIVINDNKTVTCIIFNPQGHEKKLTISGSGKIIHDCPSFNVGMFVGPDRELVFDVDVDKASYNTAGSGYNIPAIVGGGRITVKRNFPGILVTDSYKRAGYVIDGELAFAGTTTFLTSDGYKLFGVGTWEPQGKSKIVFEDGCNLTAWRLDPSPIGNIVASDEWVQNGGSVSLANFYFTRYYSKARSPFSYTLNGGSLSVSGELTLGSYYYTVATRYSGGEFVMNGGTLTANEIRCQRYDNYIRLNGGDVYLAAGFTDTFATMPQVQTVTNEWALKIGGAKIHATGAWSNALSTEFTGLNGAATLDTAGYNVTFSKAVCGEGGLVKNGNGILTFSNSATFTGPVVVNGGSLVFGSTLDGPSDFTVNSGTLSFQAAPANELDSIVVPSASDIVVSASASGLSVKRLVIDGVLQSTGSVSVNGGTLNVTGSGGSVWVGPEGGNWSTALNWSDETVPNGATAAVDFGYSALASEATISVDTAITLTNLTYRHAMDGASLTLSGAGTLSLAAGGVISVPAGNTLIVNAGMNLLGRVTKKGLGTLVVNGVLTSLGDSDKYFLVAAEGEISVNGEVSKCRIWTQSDITRPKLTIGENAVVSNSVSINAAWSLTSNGDIVQNGGLVDLNPPTAGFVQETRWYLVYGDGKYTLNSGTLSLYRNASSFGYNNASTIEFVQNGGTLKVGNFCTSMPVTGSYTYTLNGGTNEIGNTWGNPVGGCSATMYLNGGTIISGGNSAIFASRNDVVIGGDVTFSQKNASVAVTLGSDISGGGTIRQAGPGKLTLSGDSYWFSGSLAVDGGTLGIASPYFSETTLDIASGSKVSIDCDEVVVKRLTVNGLERGAGRYSAASGKDIGGRIQGTGVLVVQEGIGPGSVIVVF